MDCILVKKTHVEDIAGSISRLNVKVQYPGSMVQYPVSYGSKNTQAQCPDSMSRLNVPDLSGIL